MVTFAHILQTAGPNETSPWANVFKISNIGNFRSVDAAMSGAAQGTHYEHPGFRREIGALKTWRAQHRAWTRRTQEDDCVILHVFEHGARALLELSQCFLCALAFVLAARKLASYEPGKRVPATICAIDDAVRWAAEIMNAIDRRWPNH